MKYFYLAADGTTAGPELLETLCAKISTGAVSLATLVVPAGGEDWTPLARVLRFFYQDAAGASAGPVAFSELNRLCQIHAIPADAWVVEESGTDWKAVTNVLSAGGVALPAPAPSPRVVHATYRPQPAGHAGDHYAAPHAPVGHRTVVRRRATGGLTRPQYFLFLILSLVLCIFSPAAYLRYKLKPGVTSWFEFDAIIQEFMALVLVCMIISLVAICALSIFRIQNIGWNRVLVLILLAPGIIAVTAVGLRIDHGGVILVLGILSLVAFIFWCSLFALPPGFARHRRLDSAAWIVFALEVLVIGGLITWAKVEDDRRRKEGKLSSVPESAP